MYIDIIQYQSGADKAVSNIKTLASRKDVYRNDSKAKLNLKAKKLAKGSRLVKKSAEIHADLSGKEESTYNTQKNNASFSITSDSKTLAVNSNPQLKVVGIIKELKYWYFQKLYKNPKIIAGKDTFPGSSVTYKPSRAPPYY